MRRVGISLTGVLGFLVVAALLAVVAVAVLRESRPEAAAVSTGCESRAGVQVTTTTDFAPVVRAAVDRLAGDVEQCSFDVITASSADAAERIASGTQVPQVWIPDSGIWVERARLGDAGPALTVGPTLATTPVVLAVPGSLAPRAGSLAVQPWQDILRGPLALRVGDPADSTASLLALTSATEALTGTPQGDQLLLTSIIRMSRQAVAGEELLAEASTDTTEATAVAATEQQVFRQLTDATGPPLGVVVPAEGVAPLTYSWVVIPGEDEDDATRDAVARLEQSLLGVAGVVDRREAGFRTADGDGAPDVPAVPAGTAVVSPAPSLGEAQAILADWDAAGGDVRVLAVVDTSTSMLSSAGDRTRIELATDGLGSALEIVPPTSQAGLWMFSSNQASGAEWTELAPIDTLDAGRDDGGTHREALLAEVASLTDRTEGGTGLYDTVLAAYRAVQEDYDPDAVNTVVLLTDGREDEPGGLTLYRLLVELQASADPERPVPVHIIGVGTDVYEHELRLITELTGGRHHLASDPAEAGTVFIDVLTRPFRAE
ncbi:VWA domain-containing protein [Georgenia faecalis]|uniref:VWA domain-containing protein n=1 Tax=Georgenia faecalis TaxID=2483799 RepID=UPI000FD83C49|nr:VWA domain-containing protein [Georgenia faecalis]